MNKIDHQLILIKKENRLGLMTHVIVGYPNLTDTSTIIQSMADSGKVDFIELQIPFSDPLADGPTIMKACEQSLQQGTKVSDAFEIMATASKAVAIPLLFMAYYNTVFKYGPAKFCSMAQKSGASGLIIPDIPLDEPEGVELATECEKYDLHLIRVVSPASTNVRLEKNAAVATGFVYATARQGTTGSRSEMSQNIEEYIARLKIHISIPIAIGFGISKPEHLQLLQGKADIAVVGSALIDAVRDVPSEKTEETVKGFIEKLTKIDILTP